MLYGRHIVGTVGVMGGIPTLYRDFALSYADMVEFNYTHWLRSDEQVKREWATVSTHAVARNSLVDAREGDWLFFLDCDTHFPPDTLMRLHRALEQGCDVVCAPYFFGGPPHTPVIYSYDQNADGFRAIAKWERDEPFLIGAAGAGCLLVKNSVFDRIEKEFGKGVFSVGERFQTDDFPFFWKCQKLGIPVACDPRIRIGHLRVRPVTYDDHLAHLGEVSMELLEMPNELH